MSTVGSAWRISAALFLVGASAGAHAQECAPDPVCKPEPVGEPIVTSCSTEVVIHTSTGFRAPAPAGSECSGGEGDFTVNLQTGAFKFSRCDTSSGSEPYSYVTGTRKLTASERSSLRTALTTVTIADHDAPCGADKGLYTISVANARLTRNYQDSFDACQDPDVVYVDGIDNAVQAVRALATVK